MIWQPKEPILLKEVKIYRRQTYTHMYVKYMYLYSSILTQLHT